MKDFHPLLQIIAIDMPFPSDFLKRVSTGWKSCALIKALMLQKEHKFSMLGKKSILK